MNCLLVHARSLLVTTGGQPCSKIYTDQHKKWRPKTEFAGDLKLLTAQLQQLLEDTAALNSRISSSIHRLADLSAWDPESSYEEIGYAEIKKRLLDAEQASVLTVEVSQLCHWQLQLVTASYVAILVSLQVMWSTCPARLLAGNQHT
jgi:hypothetical protein